MTVDPSPSLAQSTVVLDVWADIVCPWCFIGHRTLGRIVPDGGDATSRTPDGLEVEVRHRAFELRPELPPRGRPAAAAFTEMFGPPEQRREVFAHVRGVGEAAGIAFDFDAMPVAANSRLAHRAIAVVPAPVRRAAADVLFSAYFERGLDITDPAVVVGAVASVTGVDGSVLRAALTAGEGLDAVLADEQEAQALGISVVPTVVADGRLAVQGAQPAEALLGLLARASADRSGGALGEVRRP